MTEVEKTVVAAITESLMREQFGRDLERMREGHHATALEAWEEMYRARAKKMLKQMRPALAAVWDDGYDFWHRNNIPPEHKDYGKGNPFKEKK